MKRTLKKFFFLYSILTGFAALLLLTACSVPEMADGGEIRFDESGGLIIPGITKEASRSGIIGIAWRQDTDIELYTDVVRAIEEAGGHCVILPQVKSGDLSYDETGKLLTGVAETGALTEEAGKLIRCNTWQNSNVREALGDVSAVLFPGGEDISPSLLYEPEPWHGIEEERDYNAERDVSDFLLMAYCLEQDMPILAICRGMQMLSVVSGAEMIQDVPAWFAKQGREYHDKHRNKADTPGAYRDYAPHEVMVKRDSLLYEIYGRETLEGCPSWHHQAVKNVDNTRLMVTGSTETDGAEMIEGVERTDKAFAIGIQFHPEAAVMRHLDGAENADSFMDLRTALLVFRRLVEEAEGESGAGEALPKAA